MHKAMITKETNMFKGKNVDHWSKKSNEDVIV
jgi:hypothetical protein